MVEEVVVVQRRLRKGPPPIRSAHSQQQKENSAPPAPLPSSGGTVASSQAAAGPPPSALVPAEPQYPDEIKMKSEYNPSQFDLNCEGVRFFVIKSYSEDEIHRSIKYGIWCSTEHGNKRLDQAFREREGKGSIYLLFSVNSSGHFCGMAQRMSAVDYEASSSVWCQDKWKGQFKVKWIYVKDVPNQNLRHIRLENNENKAVTNSRDTQEVPFEQGKQVLKIIHSFKHTTSIFDDFIHYEKRQEEEDQRRTTHHAGGPNNNQDDRGELDNRDKWGGGPPSRDGKDYHRGGGQGYHENRDRGGFGGHGNENPRDFRGGYSGGGRGGHAYGNIRPDRSANDRDFFGHGGGGRGDGFYQRDRGGGFGGGRGRGLPPPRN